MQLGASPRPGNIVLFHLPTVGAASKQPQLELGMVVSVWKGIKQPKAFSGEVSIQTCTAFRAITLDLEAEQVDQDLFFQCKNQVFVWENHVFCRENGCVPKIRHLFEQGCTSPVLSQILFQEDYTTWTCSSVSDAWVVRIEGLVCIFDCEECALAACVPQLGLNFSILTGHLLFHCQQATDCEGANRCFN